MGDAVVVVVMVGGVGTETASLLLFMAEK